MSRTFTASELSMYDGSDGDKPVYIAVKGIVYDVSAARDFYGKGGPYEIFAGRECSRALAIMKVDLAACNDNLADCTAQQLKTLEDWITKFNSKYAMVGKVVVTLGTSGMGMRQCRVAAPQCVEDRCKSQVDDPTMFLRSSPFTPGLVATLVVVVLLTILGAYILYLEIKSSPHGEL